MIYKLCKLCHSPHNLPNKNSHKIKKKKYQKKKRKNKYTRQKTNATRDPGLCPLNAFVSDC